MFRHVVPARFKEPRVEQWIDGYRNLLDEWQMWEERALLDIAFTRYLPTIDTKTPEIVINCTFCSNALMRAAGNQASRSGIGMASRYTSYAANKPKTTSCPSCRKPLPKCSVCLMHLGTPAESMGDTTVVGDSSGALNYSFAWCTLCKHGGHVKHLLDWFATHKECPVSGCTCLCMQ